ncbi:MAG: hypothetical protein AAGJ74_00985 [Pseudomonadota bacterium]
MDEQKDTSRMKAILVLAATLAFATSPFWSSGFGGFDPNAYPVPQVDPPVQPAGYAFSIWSAIYIWLLASAGYGLVKRSDNPGWDATRWPLMISFVVGAPWISVAILSPVWATVMIWIMLGSALVALFRAPAEDRWLLQAPIALYAGWLTAASFVATGLLGAGYGVIAGSLGWAWAMLLAALAVGIAIQRNLPAQPFYGAAIVWALVAVAVRNLDGAIAVAALALVGAAAVGWVALMAMRRP